MFNESKTPWKNKKHKEIISELEELFFVSNDELVGIAQKFKKELINAKDGFQSSLKYLNSYAQKPTGKESGIYLTLDMGGSNLRSSLIELLGQGNYREIKQKVIPLRNPQYDYLSENATGSELFDLHVKLLAEVIEGTQYDKYHLGYTFSFPCKQTGIKKAQLINWAKEIKTSGVVDQDIGLLLETALEQKKLDEIITLKAIINDTVSTLLTAAYDDYNCDIGSILGTGHNTCYIEPQTNHIINLESGNFNGIRQTNYDEILDFNSKNPGQQQLEKMVSGKYIGEIFRLIIKDISDASNLFGNVSEVFKKPYTLTGKDLSIFIQGNSSDIITYWQNDISKTLPTPEEMFVLRKTATFITERSAILVTGTYLGILFYLDPQLDNKHVIAIDGSLFEKMPGYDSKLRDTLSSILTNKSNLVEVKLAKNASRIGAAIAAANSNS